MKGQEINYQKNTFYASLLFQLVEELVDYNWSEDPRSQITMISMRKVQEKKIVIILSTILYSQDVTLSSEYFYYEPK